MKTGKNREGEKGAALVMVVMITLLLLAAVGGLLLEVSMNTANITDATAEQQAYNAAESGIQSAINVLRGNRTASVLIETSKPATDPLNTINFRKAVNPSVSNLSSDTSGVARLSRWLNYNYKPNGASLADRVTLSSKYDSSSGTMNTTYDERSGYAYSVTVSDPDETGKIVSYKTSGSIWDPNTEKWTSTYTSGGVTISYTPPTIPPNEKSITLDVSSGLSNADYGTFKVSGAGDIPKDLRFEIIVDVTAPYTESRGLRGYIKAGKATSGAYNSLQFDFDSQYSELMGILFTLNKDTFNPTAAGSLSVLGTMTQAEPFRVVVTSTGYGPRGAKKVLEATIQKNFFNGMTAPATLTLVGNTNGFKFEPGDSAVVSYSGQDINSSVIIPPIGTTNDANLKTVLAKTDPNGPQGGFKGNITGNSANIAAELPFWLQDTTNLNKTIEKLKLVAGSNYYKNGQIPTSVGDNATGRGLTIVDGDLTLSPTLSGGGILVVTGKLTLHGAFNFKGLIIVTGENGVLRTGGGGTNKGILQGNLVIAPYKPTKLSDGFLAPKYEITGGGSSNVQFDSSSVANGMLAVSNFVLGVAEK